MSAKRVLSQKHKGKKGLAAFLFSRFFLFGLMVVLQVLMFVFFAYNASVEKNLNYIIMVLQFVLIIYIANDKSDPTMKLVWIMFIMFVPAIGCMMYLYFKAGIQQKIACLADAAAQGYDLRRKNGVEGNNAGAKLVHILGKHGLRRSIAAAGAGNQVGGGLAAGHADQRGGRSVLFKAAALAAGAGQTVAVGDDMPQFRGQPGGAAPALPIDDNAPANAGTQGEQNTCLYILQCTGTHFGQHCRVAIVNDHRG